MVKARDRNVAGFGAWARARARAKPKITWKSVRFYAKTKYKKQVSGVLVAKNGFLVKNYPDRLNESS